MNEKDSTYTERYLSSPNVTDNYKGYEEADLTKFADQLRDKQYLLIHGTADDNVHIQQSMILAKSLTSRGVLFKQQIYTDEGHDLDGVQRHLYRSMTTFFDDCFKRLVSWFLLCLVWWNQCLKMNTNCSIKPQMGFLVCFFFTQIPAETKAGLGNGGYEERT